MASLESLPDEMKLAIGLYIQTNSIEVTLDENHQVAYEVDSPEWKGLYAYQISSPALIGPATDAVAATRAKCDTLLINFFRREGVTRRIMTSTALANFKRIEVTILLYYTREPGPKQTNTEEAFITCTLRFILEADGIWTCSDSDCTERILSSTLYDKSYNHPDFTLRFLGLLPLQLDLRYRSLLALNSMAGPLSRPGLFAMMVRIRAVFDQQIQRQRVQPSRVGNDLDPRDFTCASPWNTALELFRDPPMKEYYRRGGGWIRKGSSLTVDPGYATATAPQGLGLTMADLTGPN